MDDIITKLGDKLSPFIRNPVNKDERISAHIFLETPKSLSESFVPLRISDFPNRTAWREETQNKIVFHFHEWKKSISDIASLHNLLVTDHNLKGNRIEAECLVSDLIHFCAKVSLTYATTLDELKSIKVKLC